MTSRSARARPGRTNPASSSRPESLGGLPGDIAPLTGVRFFAALWVVLHHVKGDLFGEDPTLIPAALTPVKRFFDLGYLAVPMFFILSGFILSHTYFARYTVRGHLAFVYLRFARLWPVHLASLLLLMVYVGIVVARGARAEDGGYVFAALPLELAMLRTWFSKDLLWNYPAWSIHAEWFAYLFLFPLAFVSFRSVSRRGPLLLVIALLVLGHTFLPIQRLPGLCADIVLLFLAGSALYRLRVLSPGLPGSRVATVGLVLVAVAVVGLFEHSQSLIYLGFAALIFGLSYDGGWLAPLLSRRAIVYGGLISYSLYMAHAVVLKFHAAAAQKLGIQAPALRILASAAFVGAALLAASALYHVIEAPCNAMLRRRNPFRLAPGGHPLAEPVRAATPANVALRSVLRREGVRRRAKRVTYPASGSRGSTSGT